MKKIFKNLNSGDTIEFIIAMVGLIFGVGIPLYIVYSIFHGIYLLLDKLIDKI